MEQTRYDRCVQLIQLPKENRTDISTLLTQMLRLILSQEKSEIKDAKPVRIPRIESPTSAQKKMGFMVREGATYHFIRTLHTFCPDHDMWVSIPDGMLFAHVKGGYYTDKAGDFYLLRLDENRMFPIPRFLPALDGYVYPDNASLQVQP